jgi:WD40 repeat protein
MQRRLQAATTEWQRAGRDNSYLATGARLAQFESWHSETDIALNQEEMDYLQASIDRRETQAQIEAERQARETVLEERSQMRLRALVVVMTLAAVVALALALMALNAQVEAVANADAAATAQAVAETNRVQAEQNAADAERSANIAATAQAVAEANRIEAEQNAADAERSAREARSLALAANARNALAANKPGLGLALAIEAYKVFQPPPAEVQQTLAIATYGPNVRYRLNGATGSVLCVATGGNRAVTVTADGALIVWDLAAGRLLAEHSLPVVARSVDLTADGRLALLGLFDGDILLWDVDRGETIQRFSGHTDVVTRAVFSPSEAQILSVSLDRTLRFWSIERGRVILEIETPGALLDVAFSPDGTRAVAGSADRTLAEGHPADEQDRVVRVWNLLNGNELHLFDPGSGVVAAVDYSPDGRLVASATWNSMDGGVIQIWNVRTGRLQRSLFGGHEDRITQVRFSADSHQVMSAGRDRRLVIWDVATGIELRRLEGHTDPVLSLALTADGTYAISGVGDIGAMALNPQVDRVHEPELWVWDLVETRAQIQVLRGHRDWVWSVAISPDGQLAASGSGPLRSPTERRPDTSVRVWRLDTGEEIHRFEGHTDTVDAVILTPDGASVLSGSWDGTVRQWSLTGEDSAGRVIFEGHEGRILDIDLSDDGNRALTTSADDSIALWDVATGEVIHRFMGHTGDVNQAIFSPDETMIASASSDGIVRLWDVNSGEETRRLEGHTGVVTGVAFSPDGTQLLSTSRDATVRLWDVATGQRIHQFIGHSQATYGPLFSPDGRMAITGSGDETVRLWDTRTGEQIRQFDGHTNWVLATAFSPDGSFALTAAEDNTVRQWRVARTPLEMIEWAQANRYVPEFTCAQREQYRIEPLCDQP